jgi:trans-aconitate methyltransferase
MVWSICGTGFGPEEPGGLGAVPEDEDELVQANTVPQLLREQLDLVLQLLKELLIQLLPGVLSAVALPSGEAEGFSTPTWTRMERHTMRTSWALPKKGKTKKKKKKERLKK